MKRVYYKEYTITVFCNLGWDYFINKGKFSLKYGSYCTFNEAIEKAKEKIDQLESLKEFKKIKNRIHSIAVSIAPEYPGVDTIDSLEQLYAIESTCVGTLKACDDLQRIIKSLRICLNWTPEQMVNFCSEIIK